MRTGTDRSDGHDRQAAVGQLAATDHAVRLAGVNKAFGTGQARVVALRDITLDFPAGSFTAVMGPSGSGKSTLLLCAAGLERPDSGRTILAGTDLSRLREPALARLRRRHIGFVFQAFNLLPSLTAAQNVALPLRLAGNTPPLDAVARALADVGLAERADHRPDQLSGGQQQRVAIARALLCRPSVLFADEPTGALDTTASRDVLRMLRTLVAAREHTVVMVTHDPQAAAHADSVVFLTDGQVVDRLENPTAETTAACLARLEVAAC